MIVIGVLNGVVDICVSVDSMDDVIEFYPDHILLEQVGFETIGWTYDGVTFSPPQG